MPDIPQHVREAMQRLVAVRDLSSESSLGSGWLTRVYQKATEREADWYHQDDLRTVAYWFIDQQREIDT